MGRPHHRRGPRPQTIAALRWLEAHQEEVLAKAIIGSVTDLTDTLHRQGIQINKDRLRQWLHQFPSYRASIPAKRTAAGRLGGYPAHQARPGNQDAYDRVCCRRLAPDAAMLARLRSRLAPEAKAERRAALLMASPGLKVGTIIEHAGERLFAGWTIEELEAIAARHQASRLQAYERASIRGESPPPDTPTTGGTPMTPRRCGVLYAGLLRRMTDESPAQVRLFASGFLAGEAEKIVLGTCQGAMFRPEERWQSLVWELAVTITEHYGLYLTRLGDEIWIGTMTAMKWVDHLRMIEPNSPMWHRIRAMVCGIPQDRVDEEYHRR